MNFLSQRIASFLSEQQEIPWNEMSGILHITLLYNSPSNEYLQNIKVECPNAPRFLFDFLLLNTARSRSSIVITSAVNLRCEGGNAIKLCEPFVNDLHNWRRDTLGIELKGTAVILTRSGELSPSWPIFSATDSFFSPTIVAQKNVVLDIQKRFRASGDDKNNVTVPVLSLDSFDGCVDQSFESFLSAMKKITLNEDHSLSTWLPKRTKEIPHLITIECGPSMTRPLYEVDGKIRNDCPVDWILLTRYTGAISSDALGENVIRKSAINEIFDLVVTSSPIQSSGSMPTSSGARATGSENALKDWAFELWKRRI
jgi:hypothetical protein